MRGIRVNHILQKPGVGQKNAFFRQDAGGVLKPSFFALHGKGAKGSVFVPRAYQRTAKQ